VLYRVAKSQTGNPGGEVVNIEVTMAYVDYFAETVTGEAGTYQIRIGH
jgi:hypothetical protein